ncbi:MAG: flagellar assembly peptidoglycan hydrolase FlgJ [Betaproteobacteria bacterium]
MAIGHDPNTLLLAVQTPGFDALRSNAQSADAKGTVKETARQFEALLMNVMLKSMRATVAQDGLFDSEQTRLYTSMLDEKLAQAMSRRGMGIAEVLERQLAPSAQARPMAASGADKATVSPAGLSGKVPLADAGPPVTEPSGDTAARAQAFIERLTPDAQAVSRETGIPARILLGHAALETGWGRAESLTAQGTPSRNLFGIKAGPGWHGKTLEVVTTEYAGGVAQHTRERFRVYDSYGDSMRDYAALLAGSPRYAEVLRNTHNARAYARELQNAGYATDPHYADKLAAVIEGKSLRLVGLA